MFPRIAAVADVTRIVPFFLFSIIGQIDFASLNNPRLATFQPHSNSFKVATLKEFEWGWKVANLGLFRLAKSICPIMEKRKKGTILVTSATAAMRGNKNQHSHASAMGGRRMLCQSLNAEFSEKGIHIAHIVIDGMVDAPDTLGKVLGPELYQKLRETKGMENDGLVLPENVADTYFHLYKQHRSTWTHEIDIRAFSDMAWWNH